MLSFLEALEKGFQRNQPVAGCFSFAFGDGYELTFEPLIFDNQWYVALYRDGEFLTEKVVVKPGK